MKPKLRAVFDTNIFISAILFGGNPRQCLELAREEEIELFASKVILLEFAKKLREKFLWREEDVRGAISGISMFTKLVSPKRKIFLIKEEPKDNRILECGLEAKADFIVSGDKKHILSLKKIENIPIVSAKEFLNVFYRKGN